MIRIVNCTVSDVLCEEHMLDEYAQESSIKDMPHPKAQLSMYQDLEERGVLRVIGAYRDNFLIGFVTVMCSVLPHYGKKVAITESFFVPKAYRKTGAGLRLLHAAQEYTKEQCAVGLLVSAPYQGSLSKVLPRVGFKHTNEVFFWSSCA